ncbi:hypothetical protein DH2020_007562 [Rehmannia glutinosa]|uniref:Reverse transcriptase Ty1/copia-type domain-containing protein n=1 Tax=Rehmannia glutinosa TaxID=99300 RepID=A0ABR0TYF4_REHGL
MVKPYGFLDPSHPEFVCKLRKSLYGLKKDPRAWYNALYNALFWLGFHSSKSDKSLFVKSSSAGTIFVLVYVDDILITGSNKHEVQSVIFQLNQKFALKDLGEVYYFLGIQVKHTSTGLHLSQTKYIKELLCKTKMQFAKAAKAHMTSGLKLTAFGGGSVTDAQLYHSTVGALQYAIITRPEISLSVNKVCQFMQNPKEHHWKDVKHILRYLAWTLDYGLHLSKASSSVVNMVGFSDADWASNVDDRRPTIGYCVFLGPNLVSWKSKRLYTVSRLSSEAEYRSVANPIYTQLWMKQTLADYKCSYENVPIFCDNISAINIAQNPVHHNRTKHIEIRHHFLRDCVSKRKIEISFVPSQDQLADIFTKPLSSETFSSIRARLGIMHIE